MKTRNLIFVLFLIFLQALPGEARTKTDPWRRISDGRYKAAHWKPYVELAKIRKMDDEEISLIISEKVDYIEFLEKELSGFSRDDIPHYLKISDLGVKKEALTVLNNKRDDTGPAKLADFLTVCSGVLGCGPDELESVVAAYSPYYSQEDLQSLNRILMKVRAASKPWKPNHAKTVFMELFAGGYSVRYINRKLVEQ